MGGDYGVGFSDKKKCRENKLNGENINRPIWASIKLPNIKAQQL